VQFKKGRPLVVAAIVASVFAFYLDVGMVLVALRAQRHFSAPAWVAVGCVALAATWTATRWWQAVIANRRER